MESLMLGALLIFCVCAALIVVAGVYLTKYADAIADLTGLGRLLVGSLLLAGATSLPELAVDISAVRIGQPDLAVGDLMGSCLCNLLILALLDMSTYSRGRMLSTLSSAHALSGLMTITLASVAVIAMLGKPEFTLMGLGPGTFAIMALYIGGSRIVFYDQRLAAKLAATGTEQAVLIPAHPAMSLGKASLGFVVAAVVILVVAPFMAHSADQLAELSGLGRSFVGTTLVALSTSLPELVASIAALRLGAYDLAIGNVFGSNSFNIAMLAVLDFFQTGPLLSVIAPVHAITGVAVILVSAIAVMGQLYRVESRIHFLEPDAFLVVALVLGAMGMVFYIG
jgi:cation:H+ antiporter